MFDYMILPQAVLEVLYNIEYTYCANLPKFKKS